MATRKYRKVRIVDGEVVGKHRGGRGVGPAKVPSQKLVGDVALLNLISGVKVKQGSLEKELTRYVREARRAGVTWQRIADALGITHQSARARWGPYPEKKSKKAPELDGRLRAAPH